MVKLLPLRSNSFGYICALIASCLVTGACGMTAAGATAGATASAAAGAKASAASGTHEAVPAGNRPACATSAPAAGDQNPLRGVCAYLSGRRGIVQVALYNRRDGKTYLLSNGDDTQYTASIVKVNIVASWLHDYQRQGINVPDNIPYSIRFLMQSAIEHSDNAAATELFERKGGCKALTRFHELIPMTNTTVGCKTASYYGWGDTKTTAADQTRLMKILAYGGRDKLLGADARRYELQLMLNVEPDQRFGITCGPWGTRCRPPNYASPTSGVTVAVKNGWKTLPTCTKPIERCPWQVNSTGWVTGQNRNYVLTVLTTDNPVGTGNLYGFSYGIDTIQHVSARIWANLMPVTSRASLAHAPKGAKRVMARRNRST